jgi:hypothetical protein
LSTVSPNGKACMQALRLVEFAFQRYYRLDCSSERGLCERHARTTERVPAALRHAVLLAQSIKDLCHPQDQAWMRHLLADAALNRFKHLEAGSGLRSNATPQVDRKHTNLDNFVHMGVPDESKLWVSKACLLQGPDMFISSGSCKLPWCWSSVMNYSAGSMQ